MENIQTIFEAAVSEPQNLAGAMTVLTALSSNVAREESLLFGAQLYYIIKSKDLAKRCGHGSFAAWWQASIQIQAAQFSQSNWTATMAEQYARAGFLLPYGCISELTVAWQVRNVPAQCTVHLPAHVTCTMQMALWCQQSAAVARRLQRLCRGCIAAKP
jgi:hypothetical protein